MKNTNAQNAENLDDSWELIGLAALVLVHRLGKNRGAEAPRQVSWEETRKKRIGVNISDDAKSGEPDNGAVDLRQFGTEKIKV